MRLSFRVFVLLLACLVLARGSCTTVYFTKTLVIYCFKVLVISFCGWLVVGWLIDWLVDWLVGQSVYRFDLI